MRTKKRLVIEEKNSQNWEEIMSGANTLHQAVQNGNTMGLIRGQLMKNTQNI